MKKSLKKSKTLIAYCWCNGKIEFGSTVPDGALPIVSGPSDHVRTAVEVLARWSNPTERGGDDSCPLVPGVPEADTDVAKLEAVDRFVQCVDIRMKSFKERDDATKAKV